MSKTVVDMRSDTVTTPTEAMKAAMVRAELGDDVFGDDPTVIELEKLCASMFGKPAGLFVPSGEPETGAARAALSFPGALRSRKGAGRCRLSEARASWQERWATCSGL
jgi:hypothetical protein